MVTNPSNQNFRTGDISILGSYFGLKIYLKFLVFQCLMKRVENLGLHFFPGDRSHQNKYSKEKAIFLESLRATFAQERIVSGVVSASGTRQIPELVRKKIYMEGISHTLADFSVKSLDL